MRLYKKTSVFSLAIKKKTRDRVIVPIEVVGPGIDERSLCYNIKFFQKILVN